jgi:hypothetical protein
MSNHYGQNIIWGPLSAPALFTGDKLSYSYREAVTKQNLADGASDNTAMALHSRKGEIEFSAEVTSGSSDLLDISEGQAIAIDGLDGLVIAHRVVEDWELLQRKRCTISATHYPDADPTGAASAGALSAFTPDQSGLGIVFPGGTLIYSTFGFSHASGVVQRLSVTQMVQLHDDDPSPDGKILGVGTHGYERMISLGLVDKPDRAALPASGSVLVITGAPDHLKNYRVISAEKKLARLQALKYQIDAAWIPVFGTGA